MYSCGPFRIIQEQLGEADSVEWLEGSSPESVMASDQGTTGILDQVMHLRG